MRIAAKGMPRRHRANCLYPAGNKQVRKIPDLAKFRVQPGETLLHL